MTTIVLVVIGVLIAGLAALMVFWFGGEAFGRGGAAARADQLINAGQNVMAAYQLYVAQNGSPPASLARLIENREYMSSRPAIDDDLGSMRDDWMSVSGDGGSFAVVGVPADVCRRVNRSLGGENTIPEDAERPMGCLTKDGSNVFYVRLKGQG